MAEEQYDDTFDDAFDFPEDETVIDAPSDDAPFDFEDEFDRLRQKSSRTSAVFDEMEMEEELEYEDERGFLARISPGQRLILLLILLVDVVVIAIGFMALFNLI